MTSPIDQIQGISGILFFNLWGALLLLIIIGLGLALNSVVPALFRSVYKDFAISVVVAIVGAVGEVFGLRGRILFIPVWLIGLGMIAIHAYKVWGLPGIILPVAFGALGLWWMVKRTRKQEVEQWAKAQAALPRLAAAPEAESSTFWRLVEESLFLPIMTDYSAEVSAHDLDVAEIVLSRAAKHLNPKELTSWKAFANFLKENRERPKPKQLDFDIKRALEDLIESKKVAQPAQ
jgi:hypothetical protein